VCVCGDRLWCIYARWFWPFCFTTEDLSFGRVIWNQEKTAGYVAQLVVIIVVQVLARVSHPGTASIRPAWGGQVSVYAGGYYSRGYARTF
jgi:hypothetical protein